MGGAAPRARPHGRPAALARRGAARQLARVPHSPPQPTPPSPPGEPGSTFFKLVLLVNLVARPFARVHERAHGLRLAEWRVLRALAARPAGATAGELGEALGMDKMAVSRAVRALEAAGRLARRPDPRDRRCIALSATGAGRALVGTIEPQGRAREAALLAELTDAERAALDALLDRLVRRARALPEDPDAGTCQEGR